MSTFTPEHSFDFDAYGFHYHHPSGTETDAFISVTQTDRTVVKIKLNDAPVGIRAIDDQVQIGVADFPEGTAFLGMAPLIQNAQPQFKIVSLPNGRLGGIGIEDIRDAGFKWQHTFQLECEPISLLYITSLRRLMVIYRDPATRGADESDWYHSEVVPANA